MRLKDWHLHDAEKVFAMDEVIVKIRYRKQANRCRIALDGDNLFVSLLEPLESIAKGQAAAFYDKEGLLLGGGIIC
jgi:tRNA-specific 2-thiouridylase